MEIDNPMVKYKHIRRGLTVILFLMASLQAATAADENLSLSRIIDEDIKQHRKDAPAAQAAYDIGMRYYIGLDAPRDMTRAVEWFEKSGDLGSAGAQLFLAQLYTKGDEVTRDYARAVGWDREAAEQNDGQAELDLANLYNKGLGVDQDYAQAAKWYRAAADQGYVEAYCSLGMLYLWGRGIGRSYLEASFWLNLCANEKPDFGDTAKREAEGHLTAEEMLSIQKRLHQPDSVKKAPR